ncbi:MAG: Hpt domain-containing protein [Alphaproteobacteria bacterium]|nr:Hpt domain-containing protein [Alphaproteobacteria bacterium]MBF0250810.1 Hpt domain-containing protein [Alphaproteobacteria bacterium]
MAQDFDPDLEMILADMRQEFIEETRDKIEEIDEAIERIRNRSGALENHILDVKRLMHSIKGGGGSFGFPTISKIAHGFEDYLETTGSAENVVPADLRVFCDNISAILESGREPDVQETKMMLRSLPTGRRQGGGQAAEKGMAMLLMPRGVQRKIIGQELAQFGFRVSIVEDPVQALDMAITLHPDFLIATHINAKMNGEELAWALHKTSATRNVKVAVLTSDDITEEMRESIPPGTVLIAKGPRFTLELMQFIRSVGK